MNKQTQRKPGILIIVIVSLIFNPGTLNSQTTVHTDTEMDFLRDYSGSEDVAAEPPTIDFGIIENGSGFSHWGHVVLGPDDKFYYAIGDHNPNGTVILMSYDPETKTDTVCIYSPDVTPPLADGKWHGRPVINPANGDMYLIGFYRGQVVKYNIYTKEVTNYGQVVSGKGWEEHIWDYENNRLYGITQPDILVYDTENDSVLHSDMPFETTGTDRRARMIDNETGMFYATSWNGRFYKYNPETNVFTQLTSKITADLRANTNTKEPKGSFWVSSSEGDLYRFFPDEDRLVSKGKNAEGGEYVAFMERSQDGRFLYYISASGDNHLIQYNTRNDSKKVIAQLDTYYSAVYNYTPFSFFGGALSKDGKSIFLVCNGDDGNNSNPAFFHVHMTESVVLETHEINKNPTISKIDAHPNPFINSTTISISLIKPGKATLAIMDITGKVIHTIHEGNMPSGSHEFEWNIEESGDLSRGIYFYSLQLNDERVIKKLVVL